MVVHAQCGSVLLLLLDARVEARVDLLALRRELGAYLVHVVFTAVGKDDCHCPVRLTGALQIDRLLQFGHLGLDVAPQPGE